MSKSYDIAIIGGGLVGASLVAALRGQGLHIAVIEATAFHAKDSPSFDARTVALSYGSKMIFSALGLWEAIANEGVTPIERIHISDRKHSGLARLDCRDQKVEALGYVADIRILGKVLGQNMLDCKDADYVCPASLTSVDFRADTAVVNYEQDGKEQSLTARLVIAADGGQSLVRQQSGIGTWQSQYGQTAVIANVVMDKPHHNLAYERFTDTGPMALLPTTHPDHPDNMYALVWTVADDKREEILSLDEDAFIERLQSRFGIRAGQFIKVGPRHAYPLSVMLAREHVRPRLAIIGNAAHTMHPVAGQGFNLGLRDVASLSQIIVDALKQKQDIGSISILKGYATWRRKDHLQTMGFTDGLVRLFSSRLLPVIAARNLGLLAMDVMPPVKQAITRHAMGYVGKLSRLARGIPL
ncbi:MAG: 2-octaprenyl-6-methoxyphenyl hydroxylase [Gammaproteobacteria bacterium]|nr:2-octaprenyl-6-methoxyphenyl hydroxylase [Gammaproteobacteria bacterium]